MKARRGAGALATSKVKIKRESLIEQISLPSAWTASAWLVVVRMDQLGPACRAIYDTIAGAGPIAPLLMFCNAIPSNGMRRAAVNSSGPIKVKNWKHQAMTHVTDFAGTAIRTEVAAWEPG